MAGSSEKISSRALDISASKKEKQASDSTITDRQTEGVSRFQRNFKIEYKAEILSQFSNGWTIGFQFFSGFTQKKNALSSKLSFWHRQLQAAVT